MRNFLPPALASPRLSAVTALVLLLAPKPMIRQAFSRWAEYTAKDHASARGESHAFSRWAEYTSFFQSARGEKKLDHASAASSAGGKWRRLVAPQKIPQHLIAGALQRKAKPCVRRLRYVFDGVSISGHLPKLGPWPTLLHFCSFTPSAESRLPEGLAQLRAGI